MANHCLKSLTNTIVFSGLYILHICYSYHTSMNPRCIQVIYIQYIYFTGVCLYMLQGSVSAGISTTAYVLTTLLECSCRPPVSINQVKYIGLKTVDCLIVINITILVAKQLQRYVYDLLDKCIDNYNYAICTVQHMLLYELYDIHILTYEIVSGQKSII
jgi:hypothetical protein